MTTGSATIEEAESLEVGRWELGKPLLATLLDIEQDLLPTEMQDDDLVIWTFRNEQRRHAIRIPLEPAPTRKLSPAQSQVAARVAQAMQSIRDERIPFYTTTLVFIGRQWRIAERMLAKTKAARQPENIAHSARETQERLRLEQYQQADDTSRQEGDDAGDADDASEISETPIERQLHAEARQLLLDSSLAEIEDGMRTLLAERHDFFTMSLAQAKAWWKVWHGEVEAVRSAMQVLQQAQRMLLQGDTRLAWDSEKAANALQALLQPSAIGDQLTAVADPTLLRQIEQSKASAQIDLDIAALNRAIAHPVQLTSGATADDARLGPTSLQPDHLPPSDLAYLPRPTHFIGRETEKAWLLNRLIRSVSPKMRDCITGLSGVGGIGKTALAAEVISAAENQLKGEGRLNDGVIVIVCQQMTDAGTLLQRIQAKFDPKRRLPMQTSRAALIESTRKFLTGKKALLVLDDLEPELAITAIVSPLRVAGIQTLLISRHRFPTSVIPDEAQLTIDRLALSEAVALFADAMGKDGLALEPLEQAAIESIVTALGRHTLAVQMVGVSAARTAGTLQQLRRDLTEPLRSQVITGREDVPQGLALILTRSIEELPEDTRRFFASLGAFATPEFGRNAAIVLGTALGLANSGELIDGLVARSLLMASELERMPRASDHRRVRLHPLLYARAQAMLMTWRVDEAHAAYAALARYYARYVEEVEDEAISSDKGNLAGALEWALQHGDDENAFALCHGMRAFWYNRWYTNQLLTYLPRGIAAGKRLAGDESATDASTTEARRRLAYVCYTYAQTLRRVGRMDEARKALEENLTMWFALNDQLGEAAAFSQLGVLVRIQGNLNQAAYYLNRSLDLRRQVRDVAGEAFDLSQLGRIAQLQGKLTRTKEMSVTEMSASELYAQSLSLARQAQDRRTEGDVLVFLGQIARLCGEMEEAGQKFNDSLAIMRKIGDLRGEVTALHELGNLARIRGQLDIAEANFTECLAIRREIRDRRGEGAELGYLGRVARMRRQFAKARELFDESLSIAREVNDRRGEGIVLSQLGLIALSEDRLDDAEYFFTRSLAIRKEVNDKPSIGADLGYLARIALARGNIEGAKQYLDESLQIAQDVNNKQGEGIVHAYLAQIAEQDDNYVAAERHLQDSLALAQKVESGPDTVGALVRLGALAKLRGDTGEEQALFQRAEYLFQQMQLPYTVMTREMEQALARTRHKRIAE